MYEDVQQHGTFNLSLESHQLGCDKEQGVSNSNPYCEISQAGEKVACKKATKAPGKLLL